jgi:solute carrier family 50 (sugar transporter)
VFRACRYGLPFVSPNNMLVSTINGAGAAIEAVYVVIFLAFASSQRTRLRMLGLASAVSAAFAAVALASMLALHGQGRKLMCGLAATVCSICMYASPLSIMVYVSFHGISDNYIVRHCTYGSLTVSFVRACRGWW